MALKMDRQVDSVELGYFVNEVQERGVVLVVSTGGSGVALDSPSNVATATYTSASGQLPLGVLLNDFVSIDLTRVPINWHKDQAVSGDKATIMNKGWVVTNKIVGTPTAGQAAQLVGSGFIQGVANGTQNTAAQPLVGRFRTGLNEDGYARVYFDV